VDVLDGDEPAQMPRRVDHRQLLDAVAPHDRLRLVERRPVGRRDEPLARHRVAQRAVEGALELQVAIGDDPHQPPVPVDHGTPRS
jgi:hypothetical protein